MKVTCDFISPKHYDRTNFMQWAFRFWRYTFIRGFILRVFGLTINVTEKGATQKLINIHLERKSTLE